MIADFNRRRHKIAIHLTLVRSDELLDWKYRSAYLPMRGGSRKAIAKNITPNAKASIKM